MEKKLNNGKKNMIVTKAIYKKNTYHKRNKIILSFVFSATAMIH